MAMRGRGASIDTAKCAQGTAAGEPEDPDGLCTRPRIAAVYGGGGPLGIAYGLGIVDALLAAGVPLRTAPALGTSAGSWVASCLATGTSFEQLGALPPLRVPNLTRGLLRALATEAFGAAMAATVQATAVRVPTGGRVLLQGQDHPLADLVAASSAVPWLFAPARIGRHFFADGGVRSMVHADYAPEADHLVVVAPVTGPMFGPGGRAMDLKLRAEVRRWHERTGGEVHLFRPDRQIAALARHPLDLFDKDRAKAAYPLAYAQAQHDLLVRPELAGLLDDQAQLPVA
jgi:NTE family protein